MEFPTNTYLVQNLIMTCHKKVLILFGLFMWNKGGGGVNYVMGD